MSKIKLTLNATIDSAFVRKYLCWDDGKRITTNESAVIMRLAKNRGTIGKAFTTDPETFSRMLKEVSLVPVENNSEARQG